MIVYRLARGKYALDLSGTGASLFGYRWNSKGIKAVYTASSRALAMAEVLVHLPLNFLPDNYVMLEIEIPNGIKIDEVDVSKLKNNWNSFPHPAENQEIGDGFFRDNKACVLKVPSAVVKGDFNFLLNPNHPDMKKIRIVNLSDFLFDKRIFK